MQRIVGILARLRRHRCILEKSRNSQKQRTQKGRKFPSVLNIGTVLVGVLWRGVLKRAAVEHASFTLRNSLWLPLNKSVSPWWIDWAIPITRGTSLATAGLTFCPLVLRKSKYHIKYDVRGETVRRDFHLLTGSYDRTNQGSGEGV